MSTPNAHAYGASKPTPRSSGQVFTPSASSPSRSVPSPAHLSAVNAHPKAGKSPHKHAHSSHFSYGGASAGGGVYTPTALGANTSSPAAMDNLHRVRSAKSMAGSEANTPAMSGLSGLGLFNTGINPNDTALLDALGGGEEGQGTRTAEQFGQRVRAIFNLLGTRWGRVSQESLVASVPRLGLEGMWEDRLGDTEVIPGKSRTYIIAGKGFSVEIEWLEGRVKNVVLDLPNARGNAKRSLGRAAEILRQDLVGGDDADAAGRYVDLKHFASNLQRLAITDQLGLEKASCFEALEGLYASLSRIWSWELEQTKARLGGRLGQRAIELEVLRHRSGRPTMHANGRIGLKLDYWLDRSQAAGQEEGNKDEKWSDDDQLWSLLIECQACDPTQYPPIRISDNWVAEDVGKESAEIDGGDSLTKTAPSSIINWEEPAIMIISDSDVPADHDPMDIDAAIQQAENSTQPTVRFLAKFDPPVTVPYSTAAEIYQHVGQAMPQEPLQMYAPLLFPEKAFQARHPGMTTATAAIEEEEGSLSFRRTVYAYGAAGEEIPHRCSYTLFTQPSFYGRTMHEIPFSHPSQLVTILPFLRQWAFLGQLLRRTVGATSDDNDDHFYSSEAASNPSSAKATRASRPSQAPPRPPPQRPLSPPSDTDSDDDDDDSDDASNNSNSNGTSPPSANNHPLASPSSSFSSAPYTSASHQTKTKNKNTTSPFSHHHTDLTLSYTYSPPTLTSAALRRIDLDVAPLYGGVGGGFGRGGGGGGGGGNEPRRAMLRVLPNGMVDLEPESEVGDGEEVIRKVKRAVELCEDLGLVRVWWNATAPAGAGGGGGGAEKEMEIKMELETG